jgi:hypothetical protein
MMSSPPLSPQSLTPQEYETPTTLVQEDRVSEAEYEEFTVQDIEKNGTQRHDYQPPPQHHHPVYMNKPAVSGSQDSGVYASVASKSTTSKAVKTPPHTKPPPTQDYSYKDGDSHTTPGIAKILKLLMACLVVVMVVVATVISIAAIAVALTQTCECTGGIEEERLADNLEMIQRVSATMSELEADLMERIDTVSAQLQNLNQIVINGAGFQNCTTDIESSCRLADNSPQCTTPPVNYQQVIDFSCVYLNDQDPMVITGTLSNTAILSENKLVCQCTIAGLGDRDSAGSICGLKVTRCV